MSDLKDRLNAIADLGQLVHIQDWKLICVAASQAASHIEALEARNKKLEEALTAMMQFAAAPMSFEGLPPSAYEAAYLTARSALRGE
jgi:hypothetical protein